MSPWETDNHSANQEISCPLWNPKVHYRVHNSQILVPILNHLNSIHTLTLIFCKVHFSIIPYLPPGLQKRSLRWNFPTNILCVFLIFPGVLHAPPIYISWFGLLKIIKFNKVVPLQFSSAPLLFNASLVFLTFPRFWCAFRVICIHWSCRYQILRIIRFSEGNFFFSNLYSGRGEAFNIVASFLYQLFHTDVAVCWLHCIPLRTHD
jgi:hypothetical protein